MESDNANGTDRTSVPRQHTLADTASVRGVGLHTGREVTLRFAPAPPGSGIVWRRSDVPGSPALSPGPDGLLPWVTRTERATTLGRGDAAISTVEHVMAALAGLGIDNATVEVDGPETPLMDGSAAPFVDCLRAVGVVAQDAPRAWRRLREPVWYEDGDAVLVALPAPALSVSYTFVSDHPALGCQHADFRIGPEEERETYAGRFRDEVAPARTVGWLHEVEALWARGLARGASMEAALVVDEERLLTPPRLANEAARHKLLDLLGDLYLLGPVQARIIALRSGHRHHVAFARLLARATELV